MIDASNPLFIAPLLLLLWGVILLAVFELRKLLEARRKT